MMIWRLLPALCVVVLLGAGCGPSTSMTPPTSAPAPPTSAPAGPTAVQPQGSFTRPEVEPLPPAGRFQVVSQAPWPGEKVRVFFLGAQF
jgi:hypothetical protein